MLDRGEYIRNVLPPTLYSDRLSSFLSYFSLSSSLYLRLSACFFLSVSPSSYGIYPSSFYLRSIVFLSLSLSFPLSVAVLPLSL